MTKRTQEQVEVNENAIMVLALVMELNEEDAQGLVGHTPNEVRQALVLQRIEIENLHKTNKDLTENANIAAAHVKRQAHLKYKAQKELKKLQDGLMDENNKVVICEGVVHFEAIDARV